MAIHQPNRRVERARFFEMDDSGDRLKIVREIGGAAMIGATCRLRLAALADRRRRRGWRRPAARPRRRLRRRRPTADPRIQKLVASVSEQRLRELTTSLVSFRTRSTLSDATSTTRGIGAARQWILDELKRSSPKLQVSFDTHRIAQQGRITREVELRNVMAVLPGKSSRRVYITGHYDTVNSRGGGQPLHYRRRGEPAGQPGDQPRRRRPRGERRRQRHRAHDGTRGARPRGERHRVRRDARVHVLGRGGAGAHRLHRARAAASPRTSSKWRPTSTTTSSGTSRAGATA